MRSIWNRRGWLGLSCALSIALLGGCARLQTRCESAPYAALSAGVTPQQAADFERHCGADWGMPEKTADFGRTYYVNHDGYVMEYSGAQKTALWVCHHVTKDQLKITFSGKYNRPKWREEELVPESVRVHDSDYPSGGKPYNRGHLAPNADFGSKEGRDGTFILSNAVPQQWQNNQQIWSDLEALVREWIETRGEAYIITGPLLYDPTDDPQSDQFDPDKSDSLIYYDVMGDSEVAVPTHLFKILLVPQADGSSAWESLAFVLENRKYDKGSDQSFDDDLTKALVSIDWIETRAELNFLSNLPEGSPEETAMESAKSTHLRP